jgi:C4-dicarboxylate-specific signal transduction histidine kinase/integral membrane sensor domain MASE1
VPQSGGHGAPAMRQHLATAGIALALCAAYYLGSILGLLLRVPPATPSIVWPPNAILTAALLLVEPRRWWLVLLPVLPVHLYVQLPTGWPLSLVLPLFLSNCSEAVITAGVVWMWSDAPPRFDTPRRLAVFFAAIVAGTMISGWFDAAAVAMSLGDPFWAVWGQRLFSNILAQLTIVPAVVGVATGLPRWLRSATLSRMLEASFVWTGLMAIGATDIGGLVFELPPLRAVSSQAPLALQLPFLLWAAVRFGTAGAGVTMFTATILAVWSAVHGQGPFAEMSPTATVSALTLSLILVAATMLALAALVEERRHTQSALAERLNFEELLARLSGAFVEVSSDRMDAGFDEWLGRIGRFLGVKCVRVYVLTEQSDLVARYEWMHPQYERLPPPNAAKDFPWALSRLQRSQVLAISSLAELPPDAETDRQSMERYGYQATLVLPLVAGNRALGALAVAAAEERLWPDEIVMRLRLVAEVLANALARKQTEDALRASEAMKSSILSSLRSGVAVVDRTGRVLALNDNWAVLANESGDAIVRVDDNLLEASAASTADALAHGDELRAGVLSVLRSERDSFGFEYTTQPRARSGRDTRWWSVVVVPLDRPQGGAVVTRADVTDLRKAELDVQRIRQELAHVGRVSTVGELTASLAHELYQPLTAIMTNAQAARRMLLASRPDISQIQTILGDIVNDDRRASDVIERLRDLLRKGQLEMAPVDLASTIRDVAHLLRGEAMVKHVTVTLDLDGFPVVVLADRVQLQQVMLNLLHNAMEAMADGRHHPTNVVVRCRSRGDNAVVSVSDTGPGLVVGKEETVFEPFYTTKKDGMGMGLSIVRSILESHGGSIRASNIDVGGAQFEFTLPLAGDAEPAPQSTS